MIRLRQTLLTLALAALPHLAAGPAQAVPLSLDRGPAPEWRPTDAAGRPSWPGIGPLARVRLLTVEIALLPSGALVAGTLAALPAPAAPARIPAPDPLMLRLPGAMPLFVVALAGLVVVSRRRRSVTALAGGDGAA